jgi:transcriptional regulator with XRE-family HTH domain
METLGQRLRLARQGLSQQATADKLGIPQSTWNNYESGRNKPDLELLDKICVVFGIKTDWLLFGRGPMREGERDAPEQATERRIKVKDILSALKGVGSLEDIEDPEIRAAAIELQRRTEDLYKQVAEARAAELKAKDEALAAYKQAMDTVREFATKGGGGQ